MTAPNEGGRALAAQLGPLGVWASQLQWQTAALAQEDGRLADSAVRQAVARKYVEEALAMLRGVVGRGTGAVARLPNENAIFQPLRQNPEFSRLLTELDARSSSGAGPSVP